MKQCFALYNNRLVWLEKFRGSGAYIQKYLPFGKVTRAQEYTLVPKHDVTVLTFDEAVKYQQGVTQ